MTALKDCQGLTQAALEDVARDLAAEMDRPTVIALNGSLGAGKSTFARAMLRAFGAAGDIPSPTFNLVQVYEGLGPVGCDIWHVDAYRLTAPEEAEPLGLLDAFDTALCLIEWPQNLGAFLPRERMDVMLSHTEDAERRNVSIEDLAP